MALLLLLLPLVAGVLLLVSRSASLARPSALAITLANLVVTLVMLSAFQADGRFHYEVDLPWVASAGIHFRLGLDGVSLLMVLLTNLLSPFVVYSSFNRRFDSEARYYGLVLLMQGALNGVFMATDGLLFYIFYELALIPIYFISAIWGGDNRVRITLKFFVYTFIGSLFMLVALIYMYLQTPAPHSFRWEDLTAVQLAPEAAWWVMLGFFLAFAVKMPVFPFHTWQPDTYTSAPTGGAMLLAGIMLKMGVYGLLRWMVPLAPEALPGWTPIFIGLAVTGIVYAGIIAIKQNDFKRLIAYSSIAHVGLIAAGALAWNKFGLQGSLVQMLNHGINVIGLFYVSDLIERRMGTRSLNELGGIARVAPRFATLFMILLLGSVAVPLTNGFVGEFLLLQGVYTYSAWLGAVAGLTIILGAVYMLRAYGLAMFGETNAQTEQFGDLKTTDWVVLGLLSALVLAFGFFPQWVFSLTETSVDRLLGTVQF